MLALDSVVEYDCLSENGEHGFSSFGGASNITLSYDEISWNDALGGCDRPGSPIQCGCSGGGKHWISHDVTVSYDYVHDNNEEGIIYEIRNNGLIEDNTLDRNAIGGVPGVEGFPDSAVYISEPGFDPRAANPFHETSFAVQDNLFRDNWGGVVVIWENPNRYWSDGFDSVCTLVDPSVYTLTSCADHLSERSPVNYYDNSR